MNAEPRASSKVAWPMGNLVFKQQGLGLQFLPTMHKALGSTPSTGKKYKGNAIVVEGPVMIRAWRMRYRIGE